MPGRTILSLHPPTSTPSLLVLSNLLSPGVETEFKGRGECVDSPPPPSSPSELEIHLQAVSMSCDPCMTGLVDLQDMDRWKVEELSRMQDPTGDNKCVDQQLFIRVGRDWVERVVDKEENKLGELMKEEKEEEKIVPGGKPR
jgi:hypothetical protein